MLKLRALSDRCWLHDLAAGEPLDEDTGPIPDSVLPQDGLLRTKWMSHTLFQLFTSTGVIAAVGGLCRRWLCGAIDPVVAADRVDEGGDPEWVMLVSAMLGAVVIYAALQVADAVYRCACLIYLSMLPVVCPDTDTREENTACTSTLVVLHVTRRRCALSSCLHHHLKVLCC